MEVIIHQELLLALKFGESRLIYASIMANPVPLVTYPRQGHVRVGVANLPWLLHRPLQPPHD